MKKWLKRILSVLGAIAVLVLASVAGSALHEVIYQARYFSNLPEYTEEVPAAAGNCVLCDYAPTNGPCVINLNLGKMGEIQLYDRKNMDSNQVDDTKSEYGIARSGGAAGATYMGFPDNHTAHIGIHRSYQFKYSEEHAKAFFCDDCMEKIRAVEPNSNFLFADCYNKDNVTLYKLEDAEDGITIRHYTITVDQKNDTYLYLDMVSSYFTGGSELDY